MAPPTRPPERRPVAPPRFRGRRSAEERAALAQAEQARFASELGESASSAARQAALRGQRAGIRGQGLPGRGRGRGGLMPSGPLSSGVAPHDPNRVPKTEPGAADPSRGTRLEAPTADRSGRGGRPGSTSTRQPQIKKEPIDGQADSEADGIKSEIPEVAYVSSDEDDTHGPRKDVDTINLVSDEDDEDEIGGSRRQRFASTIEPVRINRVVHRERPLGINTDASSATAAELRKQAEARGGMDKVPVADIATSVAKKDPGAQDMEVLSTERRWKGVYLDSDEEDAAPAVKDDPDALAPRARGKAPVTDVDIDDDVDMQLEPRPPARKPAKHKAPVLQTDEERAEWDRYLSALSSLRLELGPSAAKRAADADGDHAMQDDDDDDDAQPDRLYLFQLPPIVPDLLPTLPLSDAASTPTDPSPTDPSTPHPPTPGVPPERKISLAAALKTEGADADVTATLGESATPRLAAGRAGTLRVHASGRTTVDWGGVPFEVRQGVESGFLQDCVLVRMPQGGEPGETVKTEDGEEGDGSGEGGKKKKKKKGEAYLFGQVRGKLVMVPDWEAIMG